MSQGSTATELVASLDRALAGILPLTDILEPFALQSKGTPAHCASMITENIIC